MVLIVLCVIMNRFVLLAFYVRFLHLSNQGLLTESPPIGEKLLPLQGLRVLFVLIPDSQFSFSTSGFGVVIPSDCAIS